MTTSSDKPFKRGKYYYIRYEGSPDPITGERKQVMKSCRGMTYKEALQSLAEEKRKVALGEFTTSQRQTVGEFLETWLRQVKGSLEETTWDNYATQMRSYVIPRLGETRLDKLTPLQLQQFYTDLLENGSRRRKRQKGLTQTSVRNVHTVLKRALKQAVRWGLRPNNPADQIDPPQRQQPEVHIAKPEGISTVITLAEDSDYQLPILIALNTGMRRGEVLGLQWQDFDATNSTLTVCRAICQTRNSHPIIKSPKTRRGRRLVPITTTLRDELQRVQKSRTAHNSSDDWICCDSEGNHLIPGRLTKIFAKLAKKAKIDTTFHGLRHLQATMLISAGIPVKAVSERLGHASVSITQDIYTHVLPTIQNQLTDVLDRLISPPTPKS